MNKILVVDDMAIFREPISATVRRAGYTTLTAANGTEALETVRLHHPDLVLLDMAMPVMDGISFLRALRSDPAIAATRIIILSAMSERDAVSQALGLGVQGYLLKSQFSSAELLSRIQRCLAKHVTAPHTDSTMPRSTAAPAPTEARVLVHAGAESGATRDSSTRTSTLDPAPVSPGASSLTREQTLARLKNNFEAKTLAGNVAEVMMLAGSSGAVAADLATALKRDPVIAARVLQVANSPAHLSRRGHVTNVDEAIRNIGFATIRNLAAGIAVFEAFPRNDADGYSALHCWQHSFAVASIMSRLPHAFSDVPAGIVHLVGLCHDLAEIVLRQIFAAEYKTAIELADRTSRPMRDVEAEIFGLKRDDLAAAVLAEMRIPREVVSPILELECRGAAKTTKLGPVARLLRLANFYSHGMFLAPSPQATIGPLTKTECRNTLGDSDIPLLNIDEIRSEVLTLTTLLAAKSGARPDDQADGAPPQSNVSICYGRDSAFASLDPIASALAWLADPHINDRLAQARDDLAQAKAAIIVTPNPLQGEWSVDSVSPLAQQAGCPNIPILYLTSESDPPTPALPANFTIAHYPLSLARFVDLVQSLIHAGR